MYTDHKITHEISYKKERNIASYLSYKIKKIYDADKCKIDFEVTRKEILHIPKVSKEWGCQCMRRFIVIETCISYRLAGGFYSPSLLEFLLSITPLNAFFIVTGADKFWKFFQT